MMTMSLTAKLFFLSLVCSEFYMYKWWPYHELVSLVLQLWSNVRNAFGDQPDCVELAETLSQNFESLYDKEVGVSLPLPLYFSSASSLYLNCCLDANVLDTTRIYNIVMRLLWHKECAKTSFKDNNRV